MTTTTSALRVLLASGALLTLHGCAHAPALPPPPIAPDAEPAEPIVSEEGERSLNTEVYLGTRTEEAAQLSLFAKQMVKLQARQARDHDQPAQRGFHAKSHGCLWGHLRLRPERDARTRYGVFGEGPTEHPIWVRFSNGVGWRQSDQTLDARGMAIKVMGVEGKKYMPDEKRTQDFLMTNSPTPVGKNAEQFMRFAHANASGRAAGLYFLATHPRSAAPALLRTGAIPSAVSEQYWSGGAYHLGAHQAVKFTAKPCEGSKPREAERDGPDYLRHDLAAAAQEGLCYTFYVQFQVDPSSTPVEDAAKEWTEEVSPLVPVADVLLPPQRPDSEKQRAFCDQLSFNPWHAVRAHKPMGHINRARRFVYEASRQYRKGGHEPTGFEGFDAP